jgi:hypothetical protein
MQGYDNWKLDSPEYLSDPDPSEEVVRGEQGWFAWQTFCQTQQQNNVADEAWQTCRKGPFTRPITRLIFRLEFIQAKLRKLYGPLRAAGLNCSDWVDQAYLDACEEVEATWREELPYYSAKCIQDEDFSINRHLSEIFSHEE